MRWRRSRPTTYYELLCRRFLAYITNELTRLIMRYQWLTTRTVRVRRAATLWEKRRTSKSHADHFGEYVYNSLHLVWLAETIHHQINQLTRILKKAEK